LALLDLSLDTRQHLHAGAASKEILFNPGVPALEVALEEPAWPDPLDEPVAGDVDEQAELFRWPGRRRTPNSAGYATPGPAMFFGWRQYFSRL